MLPLHIRVLLLDVGGTIVGPNFRRIADELMVEGLEVTLEALVEADRAVRFDLDRDDHIRATSDADRWSEYMGGLVTRAGLCASPDAAVRRLRAYHDEHNLWEEIHPGVVEALERLQSRYRLGVVSNANGTVRAKLHRIGLGRFFEHIVDSAEEGVEKPDPRIFHAALDRMGASPAETAYVGDLYHVDVVGARAAGLHPILLDPGDHYAHCDCPRVPTLGHLL